MNTNIGTIIDNMKRMNPDLSGARWQFQHPTLPAGSRRCSLYLYCGAIPIYMLALAGCSVDAATAFWQCLAN